MPDLPGRGLQSLHAARAFALFAPARSTTRRASAPDVHIYTRSKLGWVVLPDSVPAFATYYDTQKLWPEASLDRLQALTASKR